MKKHKIHDYSRIVTNPKYKYLDEETCGSAYFEDGNMSERETEIRDIIKKSEANKQRMEKRKKKKQEEDQKKTEKKKKKTNEED